MGFFSFNTNPYISHSVITRPGILRLKSEFHLWICTCVYFCEKWYSIWSPIKWAKYRQLYFIEIIKEIKCILWESTDCKGKVLLLLFPHLKAHHLLSIYINHTLCKILMYLMGETDIKLQLVAARDVCKMQHERPEEKKIPLLGGTSTQVAIYELSLKSFMSFFLNR